MPRNVRITGEEWVECDVCGFEYPKSRLSRQHPIGGRTDGYVVCPRCADNPGHLYFKRFLRLPDENEPQEIK